jgi:beta-phosphoglucomutase
MSKKIRAVIFDMDGVLIDAKDWHYEALNRALNHFGFNISRYDHVVTFDGLPTRQKLEMLTRENGLPSRLHSLINELKQIYTIELVHARCRPRFQTEFALSRLKSAGYRLAIASNSVRHSIELMMSKSQLMRYFDVIVSNEDVTKGKPDPEIYLKTMRQLGVLPHEVLVVEDHEYGIAAGRNAGARLMVVQDVNDVAFDNILKHISIAEEMNG